jgi:hypothetical protein
MMLLAFIDESQKCLTHATASVKFGASEFHHVNRRNSLRLARSSAVRPMAKVRGYQPESGRPYHKHY